MDEFSCPLCLTPNAPFYSNDKLRSFFRCSKCDLTFASPKSWLSPSEEKKRYDFHQNSPEDTRYREFLNRLCTPMCELLPPYQKGLDFGCGPGPTLDKLFVENGHTMDIYDLFYFNHPHVFNNTYDFIVASEVIEHVFNPKDELNRLWQMIKPGGLFGIMTMFVPEDTDFKTWHYKNDDTHICFYSTRTFEYLKRTWNATLVFKKNVAIFKK